MLPYLFLVEEGHVGFVEVGLAPALRHHSQDQNLKKREKEKRVGRLGQVSVADHIHTEKH